MRRDTQHPLESHSALTEVVELIEKHLILGELAREFWASKTHDLAASNQRGFWASRKIVGKGVGLGKTTHLARFVAPQKRYTVHADYNGEDGSTVHAKYSDSGIDSRLWAYQYYRFYKYST